jgi:hypothetical protein
MSLLENVAHAFDASFQENKFQVKKKVTYGFYLWGTVIDEACKTNPPHSGGNKKQHTPRDFNSCQ